MSDVPRVGTLPRTPAINQEVIPADLDRFPSIVAVVDRDGDVWVRDGDVWSPADFSTDIGFPKPTRPSPMRPAEGGIGFWFSAVLGGVAFAVFIVLLVGTLP